MKKQLQIRNSTAEFLIFTGQAGEDGIEVRVEGEIFFGCGSFTIFTKATK